MNNGESVCSSASLTFFSPGETPFHIIDYLRQSPNVKENIVDYALDETFRQSNNHQISGMRVKNQNRFRCECRKVSSSK